VERGLVESRTKAQAIILSGNVIVEDVPISKAGAMVLETVEIRIKDRGHPFVSRGGIKLSTALKEFEIDPKGYLCVDIGASTGGFTDVLLKSGAEKIYAIDVGHSQLDWSIRSDSKVVVIEKYNARNLLRSDLKGIEDKIIQLFVVDVSFISLRYILGPIKQAASAETKIITLIKPQFEVGKEKVGPGGIVISQEYRAQCIEDLKLFSEQIGLKLKAVITSPILGSKGNEEYLALWSLA
jgi:23S rRNA (cytidine1920-2'-O)/16S rRNA (cytidine1409-2'-O)-methyltransferase